MIRAKWNGEIVAESDHTVVVEGNHYFPCSDVRMDLLSGNTKTTSCPWKGIASYYDVVAGGETNPAAAWYYPDPKPAAKEIKDRIAFWKGVKVS